MFIPLAWLPLPMTAQKYSSRGIPADDQKLRETVSALEKWDGEVNAESAVAPLAFQMRAAFRTRILTAALGPDLFKIYEWHNSEIILDRLMSEQPKDWLPKEFNSYADLLKACYVDARQALTKNPGPDESKWKWGEIFKVRFNHYLASAPFDRSAIHDRSVSAEWRWQSRSHGQRRQQCLDALDRRPQQLGPDTARHHFGRIRLAEQSALERSARRLAQRHAARVSIHEGGG